jgi:16S rRNA (cytosine967-C5)-methyltransferase
MISSRELAYDVLVKAIKHRSYINLQLKGIQHPDMPFVNALVYGVMQHSLQLQHLFHPFATKNIDVEVDVICMMSGYQKHYMHQIPDYAIKAEALKLCDKHVPYAKKFVNAMLERIFEAKLTLASSKEDIKGLSLETSFQPWILKMWQSHYGADFAYDFASFSNTPSDLFGFVHYDLKEKLEDYGEPLGEWTFRADKSIIQHPDFLNKKVFIADIHAQKVGFNTPIKPNDRVLDACGAPGGKSLMMAMKVKDQAEIICADIAPHRIALVNQTLKLAKIKSVTTQVLDATLTHEFYPPNSFDGILVDAPCSGLGVLRRKPEIKMFITPQDIDSLVKTQAAILNSCAVCVKPQGWLVYSTCTLNKKENEKQIESFLKLHEDFICESIMPFDSFSTGGDGFFMATLRKIK